MINKKRLIVAYLLAPLMPTIYYVILFEVMNRTVENEGRHPVLMIAIFSLPLSYLSCLIGGTLVVNFLIKKNYLIIFPIIISGFIMGAAALFLFSYFVTNYTMGFKDLIWGGAFGVSVAMPFGLIAGIPWKLKR